MGAPDPIWCTLFLLLSFFVSGLAQVAWLKSDRSKRFAHRLDRGMTVRGKHLFGHNKTWRGFVVMVPAVAISFALFGGGRAGFGESYAQGLWALSVGQYFAVGAWVGFAFMLAELPNSFLKRQFDIAPGEAPPNARMRAICFVIDQVDSVLGGLVALALCVPVPPEIWVSVILSGLVLHWLFNVLLKQLGMKTRAA